ncbi:putative phospholipid-translocating P-type ATPase (flippase) [Anopheles sinensis]|uniref:Putative phospholipid-translocating P-type ATPase (Flippase) n=1 Tax=Anopheles sinensis TaxID=74873 RepID=A0A084WFN3_ANOSI|nr:putative phospholipid-translocating P-type ATPase (flippase) [Anopheles sinensis]
MAQNGCTTTETTTGDQTLKPLPRMQHAPIRSGVQIRAGGTNPACDGGRQTILSDSEHRARFWRTVRKTRQRSTICHRAEPIRNALRERGEGGGGTN